MSKHWCASVYLFLIFSPFLREEVLSAADSSPSSATAEPVSITAEKMTLKNLEDRIVFENAVVIKQGALTITADRAEVFLVRIERSPPDEVKSAEQEREVSKIVALGNVKVKRGLQRAKAEKGVYDRGREVIVLTGDPEVWDAGYHVKGEVITFFIAEERTLVSDSQVVIHNGSEKGALTKGPN